MRQPITSVIGPLLPCPTATTRSPTLILPDIAAGPPGTIERITVYSSSSRCSTAPMPSSESRIEMLKFSVVRGFMYAVCGSIAPA
jgi:hypothetical protein